MAKSANTAGSSDPYSFMKVILVLIGCWLIYVGIRFVYTLHPVAGIVCIICGVALIVFYFLIRDQKKPPVEKKE